MCTNYTNTAQNKKAVITDRSKNTSYKTKLH